MALISSSQTLARNPVTLLRRLWRTHAPLTLFAGLTVVLTLFFVIGIFADPRTITGAPAWLKPAKFGVSITLYSFTMVWLLGFIATDRVWKRRLVGAAGWIIAGTFIAEMVPITLQVVRGTTSHFNVATPFDTALWSMMGTAIMVLWVTNFGVAALLLFQRFENRAFAWALRLGLIITIVGMGLGFLMTVPTAQQLAGWQAGGPVTVAGAHTVGLVGSDTADSGPGLPVVGWSTQGGDLRVGHFVGMHALQVLPFLGLFVTRRRKWSVRQQVRLVVTAAVGYLGVVLLVTWQALRAQPLVRQDALTVGVFAALLVGVLLSAWWTARARFFAPEVGQDIGQEVPA
ncbi:hypothetical protein BH24DEI2_BH24DEI2_04410 [soil metagenome]